MPSLLKQFFLIFTSEICFEEYFLKYNFLHGECFRVSVSKTLGAAIIVGSVTVKVPQIVKIIKSRDVEGIKLLGVLLDLFAITSSFAYAFVKKFPFSAWGETFFLAIQTATIAVLILYYTNRHKEAVIFLVLYLLSAYMLMAEIVPLQVLWSLQILNLPIVIVGKGIQAYSNYCIKSTGQLSFITCWMQFAGTTARIFTSMQETGDPTFILSFVVCSVLNGIVALQFLIYKPPPPKVSKKLK